MKGILETIHIQCISISQYC